MMSNMRTTVTLDADTEALIRRAMEERGVSFKRALNDAIRSAARPSTQAVPPPTRSRRMGRPNVSLDHALRIAADLEDAALLRRTEVGK